MFLKIRRNSKQKGGNGFFYPFRYLYFNRQSLNKQEFAAVNFDMFWGIANTKRINPLIDFLAIQSQILTVRPFKEVRLLSLQRGLISTVRHKSISVLRYNDLLLSLNFPNTGK